MRSFRARPLHFVVASLVAGAVAIPAPALANPLAGVATFQEPMDKARELYTEGESLYSAADYDGAIQKFTEALTIVSKHGSAADAQVRGLIMFNIAKAHIEAYDVDTQLNHLRQARSIYKRFVAEGEAAGYQGSDIEEAQAEIERLEARITEIEESLQDDERVAAPGPTGNGAAEPGVNVGKLDEAQKAFGIGIGLTVGGVVLVGGGIAAVVWGATVDQHIADEIDRQRGSSPPVSESDPRTPAEQDFAEQEQLKGNIWLGVGAAVITMGAASIGVGAWQLAKSKKLKSESGAVSVAPMLDRQRAGLVFSGRF